MSRSAFPIPGLYIHIPFCRTKCAYCDFFSITDTGLMDDFLRALCREAEIRRGDFPSFDTIYVGGGTPSVLPVKLIETILCTVRRTFTILPDTEITLEVNPADWGQPELKSLRGMGVNRLSIGVQSLDDMELRLLGRRHTAEQAMRTLENAAGAGFENICVDLIYGLPGQSISMWQETLAKAVSCAPAHLSCYELEIKKNTPLGLRFEHGEYVQGPEEQQREFFRRTSAFLSGRGYLHYEISNFARGLDKASRHNLKYWDHTPYLGLGPSAHSFHHNRRWWNHGSVQDYVRDLDAGKLPINGTEELTREQLALEALFLGLRTSRGIDTESYARRYGTDLAAEHGPVLEEWQRAGLVEITHGCIRPTLGGMAVSDSLALL
jgi:oxygen-independent coproporphyrinogen-3 oxidase